MKKTILLVSIAAILFFAAGIGSGWLLFHQEPEPAAEPQICVRAVNGNVQWSAGAEWTLVGTLLQLSESDPYAAAASWDEYPAAETLPSAFFIGEVPKAKEPEPEQPPTEYPSYPSGGGSSGGNSSGGGNGGSSSGGEVTPPPVTPSTPPPTTPSTPQDGEDVGWSDDLL